jgi:hypothetical protein
MNLPGVSSGQLGMMAGQYQHGLEEQALQDYMSQAQEQRLRTTAQAEQQTRLDLQRMQLAGVAPTLIMQAYAQSLGTPNQMSPEQVQAGIQGVNAIRQLSGMDRLGAMGMPGATPAGTGGNADPLAVLRKAGEVAQQVPMPTDFELLKGAVPAGGKLNTEALAEALTKNPRFTSEVGVPNTTQWILRQNVGDKGTVSRALEEKLAQLQSNIYNYDMLRHNLGGPPASLERYGPHGEISITPQPSGGVVVGRPGGDVVGYPAPGLLGLGQHASIIPIATQETRNRQGREAQRLGLLLHSVLGSP